MNFAQAMVKETQKKLTENGAMAYSTTNNALLDLFGTIGALRSHSETEIQAKFAAAFNEDPLLATKMLFYARDIREGGLGERRTFRICLIWLSEHYPEIVEKNILNIFRFGRFDDVLCLLDTPHKYNKELVISCIAEILKSDIDQINDKKPCSLLGKWLPSENASSDKTRKYAKIIRKGLGLSEPAYRKLLSRLRSYIKVVERQMSLGEWKEIDYPSVPSYAMLKYRNAFARRDTQRFSNYIESLKKNEVKVNASTLFPYDLVHNYTKGGSWNYISAVDTVIEEQWKALPNYVSGENNFIVMADVSGSMYGRPLDTSIGLATYFAQRATSFYHNLYMTFTSNPHFVDISDCDTLCKIVKKIAYTEVGYSTNLMKAFDYILETAIDNNISQEELPKALIVISDMEIDPYFKENEKLDFIETVKNKFKEASYTCPKLILWNVEARNDTFLSQSEEVIFVSGQSPSVFKSLCASLSGKTAWDLILETLNNKNYDCIKI